MITSDGSFQHLWAQTEKTLSPFVYRSDTSEQQRLTRLRISECRKGNRAIKRVSQGFVGNQWSINCISHTSGLYRVFEKSNFSGTTCKLLHWTVYLSSLGLVEKNIVSFLSSVSSHYSGRLCDVVCWQQMTHHFIPVSQKLKYDLIQCFPKLFGLNDPLKNEDLFNSHH